MNRKMFAPGEMKLDDKGFIEAAFAQLNVVDKDNDVTLPGAFPAKDVPMSAYGHTSWEGALPIGVGTIGEKGDWAVFSGHFFMDTPHGQAAYATVKGLGALTEYSYGYDVLDSAPAMMDGVSVRQIKSLDVFEVSPVLRGAGVGTHTLAIKSGAPEPDAPYAEQMDWIADRLSALIEWTEDRKAARESEGRDLSTKDTERLDAIASKLLAHIDAIGSLVGPAEPADDRQAIALMVEIERARALGVPV